MTPALSLTHVLGRLRDARERIAHGTCAIPLALAGHPISTALARLAEAEEAKHAASPPPWALVLVEALALVEEAREAWGDTPAHMPPATVDLAPCGRELRLHLPDARACEELRLAWEDSGGLNRTQALCVVHLAVCLAEWRVLEERADSRDAQARAELEHQRRERAAVAARAIWGGQPKAPEPVKEMRSLRDLAAVSSAFSDWGGEES